LLHRLPAGPMSIDTLHLFYLRRESIACHPDEWPDDLLSGLPAQAA